MKTRTEAPKNNASRPSARASRTRGTTSEGNSMQAPSREQMIAEAAYYRAEQRGFAPGHEMADWLLAEADVERALSTLH
jgi:hypothetical protein